MKNVFVRSSFKLVCCAVFFLAGLGFCRAADEAARTTESRSLFNGHDLAGWHADVPEMDKDSAARNPFVVRDGMLVSLGTPGGHLITDDAFENYRLEVEYRFAAKPGNCGVLVHASKPRALYGMFPQSLEVQMQSGDAGDFWCIKEDITVPDMEKRRGPKEKWGVDGRIAAADPQSDRRCREAAGRVEQDGDRVCRR